MKYTKEIELIDDFCKFLEKQGCEYKREVRKGSYHSEGYFDILIKKNNNFIAIEAKIKGFKQVMHQAFRNLVLCDFSYILYPRKPSQKNLEECKRGGYNSCTIGIIIPNGKNNFLYLTRSKRYSTGYYSKIERNWNENRIGRQIHAREIPLNYNMEKINDLKPNYNWVKQNLTFDDKPLKKPRLKFKS